MSNSQFLYCLSTSLSEDFEPQNNYDENIKLQQRSQILHDTALKI